MIEGIRILQNGNSSCHSRFRLRRKRYGDNILRPEEHRKGSRLQWVACSRFLP